MLQNKSEGTYYNLIIEKVPYSITQIAFSPAILFSFTRKAIDKLHYAKICKVCHLKNKQSVECY